MAPWEGLSRLGEVVWGGRASRWKGKAGCAGPHPTPKSPGAAGRELRTGGQADRELLTLLILGGALGP